MSMGVKALFGIYVTQVEETKMTSGTISVNERIEVVKEDLDFWKSAPFPVWINWLQKTGLT